MDLTGSIALVTGANRGMGREFAAQLLDRGATKVYAAARDIATIDQPGVTPLQLDITDPASIAAAAELASDVTVLVNNAGISTGATLIEGDLDGLRRELETNLFGPLQVTRAFAPILRANGGGAILNMLSAMSWFNFEGGTAYGVSKAAAWNLTNGIRLELAAQGTQVTGLLVGLVDTDMAAGFDGMPKADPVDVVGQALDGIADGALEVLADAGTRDLKAALALDPAAIYPELAGGVTA
ncbi:MAG: SDR family oxidoreductase [Patulibacter sp.]|nr:SDR family oxidoreductase [Patulibacter sp.]